MGFTLGALSLEVGNVSRGQGRRRGRPRQEGEVGLVAGPSRPPAPWHPSEETWEEKARGYRAFRRTLPASPPPVDSPE